MLSQSSLVKYNTPMLVSTSGDGKGRKRDKHDVLDRPTTQTEDILNSILPPREWTEDGQLWIQYVSSTPATRLDVVNLQERLNQQLQQRQARETGICPIREELYAQCFDELIRQITINCAERGLLLLRVRDEARMNIAEHQTLYESSIAFGIRKALMSDHTKAQLMEKAKTLRNENEELQQQVEDLERLVEANIARNEERKQQEDQAYQEDVERIKRTNEQLRQSLEALLSAPKK